MKCPVLETWEKYFDMKTIPAEYLITHWRECDYCKQTLKELREIYKDGEAMKEK